MTKQGIATILRQAAGVVQQRGLARGMRQDHQGRVCALGALDQVYYDMRVEAGTWVRPSMWLAPREVVIAMVERLDLTKGDHQDPFNHPVDPSHPDSYLARWSNLSAGVEEVAGGFLKVAEMLEEEERGGQYSTVLVPVPTLEDPPVVPIRKPVEREERKLVGV